MTERLHLQTHETVFTVSEPGNLEDIPCPWKESKMVLISRLHVFPKLSQGISHP